VSLEDTPAAAAADDDDVNNNNNDANAGSNAVLCVGWTLMVFACCPACCRSVTDIIVNKLIVLGL